MLTNVALGEFKTIDLLIILVVIVLLFGAKKLPELSKSVGLSMRELRKGMSDTGDEKKKDNDQHETASQN